MVQVEAMLSGLPVVSTALPTGVPWVNQHGETGSVVPPGDAGALRGALARAVRRRRLCATGWATQAARGPWSTFTAETHVRRPCRL